jgi:hypothetical protein
MGDCAQSKLKNMKPLIATFAVLLGIFAFNPRALGQG